MACFVRACDVVCFVFDEEFLERIETDGVGQVGFDGQGSFGEARAVDGLECAVESGDALEVVDVGVVRIEATVIAQEAVAIANEWIVRIFEFTALPEWRRDDVFFLKDMVDFGHAFAIWTRKSRRIIGVYARSTADTRHIMVLRYHEASEEC